MATVVSMAEYRVSGDPLETLVTYALGSCIGVTAHDPSAGVGGILHFMLPDSAVNPEKANGQPAMFGDTGLRDFFQDLFDKGASRVHLRIKLAGGASFKTGDMFDIGKRNLLVAKRMLWKNKLLVVSEDVGGETSRTLRLEIGTGKVFLKDSKGEREI
jgi:chemotaxis protein CheD